MDNSSNQAYQLKFEGYFDGIAIYTTAASATTAATVSLWIRVLFSCDQCRRVATSHRCLHFLACLAQQLSEDGTLLHRKITRLADLHHTTLVHYGYSIAVN
jgi:hypothetical protein